MTVPPSISDCGGDGFAIDHLIDRSEPGAFAEALFLFPHSIRILHDAPCQFTETDRAAQPLRVLVACEYSGVVRDAFRARGFDAWSCDLLPTEGDPRWHIQGDVIDVLYPREDCYWDLLIAHPPCTNLAVSGARWFKEKAEEQASDLAFVADLLNAEVPHIALENPVSIISSRIRKPDCTFQPWQHGHGEVKRTCLWLKNLPALKPSNVVEGREERVHKMAPGPGRWKERSRTLPGVAAAMAQQWGDYLLSQRAHTLGGISPNYPLEGIAYAEKRITAPYAENSIRVPRREVAESSFRLAHPARVFDSHHVQPDSPEER